MIKDTLNKGISTPVAISVILVAVILVGGFALWQYLEIEEENKLPDIKFSQKETVNADYKLAENTIEGYIEALMSRERDNVLSYLSGEAKEEVSEWPESFGTSNPHLKSFEILSIRELAGDEFEFMVREYQEYTGQGIVGHIDETLILTKVDGEYLISSIETGEYVGNSSYSKEDEVK